MSSWWNDNPTKGKNTYILLLKVSQRVFITRVSRFFPLVGLSFHQLGMIYYKDFYVAFSIFKFHQLYLQYLK